MPARQGFLASLEMIEARAVSLTQQHWPLLGGMVRLLCHAYGDLCSEFRVAMLGPAGCDGHLCPETPRLTSTASQVFVFPVIDQPGDIEGFGMIALEAAAHGLATVAFSVGGLVDAVREGVSGYLPQQAITRSSPD